MLSGEERDIVEHLHDAGKGGAEIARILENRRVRKMVLNSDILVDVFEAIHMLVFRDEGGRGITKFRD